jgi:hypothetical protein
MITSLAVTGTVLSWFASQPSEVIHDSTLAGSRLRPVFPEFISVILIQRKDLRSSASHRQAQTRLQLGSRK